MDSIWSTPPSPYGISIWIPVWIPLWGKEGIIVVFVSKSDPNFPSRLLYRKIFPLKFRCNSSVLWSIIRRDRGPQLEDPCGKSYLLKWPVCPCLEALLLMNIHKAVMHSIDQEKVTDVLGKKV
jgi:hypothetical protein